MTQAIAAHPLFATATALWFGALFGLSILAVRPDVLAAMLPILAPPPGILARLVLAMLAGCVGAGLGFGLARWLARRWAGGRARVLTPRAGPSNRAYDATHPAQLDREPAPPGGFDDADDAPPQPARRRTARGPASPRAPIRAHSEIGDVTIALPVTSDGAPQHAAMWPGDSDEPSLSWPGKDAAPPPAPPASMPDATPAAVRDSPLDADRPLADDAPIVAEDRAITPPAPAPIASPTSERWLPPLAVIAPPAPEPPASEPPASPAPQVFAPEVLVPGVSTPQVSAATRIAAERPARLSPVELVERLAIAIQHRTAHPRRTAPQMPFCDPLHTTLPPRTPDVATGLGEVLAALCGVKPLGDD